MEVFLARLQFTLTVAFHFVFVPLSVGVGLIMAIFVTRAYRSRTAEDEAAAKFWLKLFTATFAVGVATGITMEFSFGTNWADYSRFVGDIFGAPLAAEALFAFFLESVFLGVLLFGRKRVSPKFYLVSSWLVFGGSCLSALWILIANSWMQTPAGAELSADGSKAVLTNFFQAAFNPSLAARYSHTVLALIVMGAFGAIAIAGWYFHKEKFVEFANKTLKVGVTVGLVATVCLFASAHATAVGVSVEQPTKLAAMEGMYDDEVPPLYFVGYVDTETQEVVAPISLPGGTSFLATGTWDTEFPGLNSLAKEAKYHDMNVDDVPVATIFQTYHLMVALSGIILLTLVIAIIGIKRKNIQNKKWVQKLLIISPLFPFIAIESGWFTAELGRQPYVVYPSTSAPDGISLLTQSAASASVSVPELMLTIILFVVIYLLILVGWARIIGKTIKAGPQIEEGSDAADDDSAASARDLAAASAAADAVKGGE